MATILEFRNVPGRTRLNFSRGAEQAACKIVIFPGVRVAYWDETAATEADDTPPRPRSATRKNAKPRRQKA